MPSVCFTVSIILCLTRSYSRSVYFINHESWFNLSWWVFKNDLFYAHGCPICMCNFYIRRGNQILLSVVVSHHVLAGSRTQDSGRAARGTLSHWVISWVLQLVNFINAPSEETQDKHMTHCAWSSCSDAGWSVDSYSPVVPSTEHGNISAVTP